MTKIEKVGFVGLGMMGRPMAARVLGAGFTLFVHDVDAARAKSFASEVGGQRCATLAELGGKVDAVVTMLPSSASVEQALFGDAGLADGLASGAVVIDMTSGVPGRTVEFSGRLAALGIEMLDAPVSGGVSRAVTGDLAIMVGGEDEIAAACEPVLAAMGRTMRTGAIGSGHAMKSLNNLVSAGGFLIGVEALIIGKTFGLDGETMVDVLNASTGMNNSTQKKLKQFVLSGKYDSGFALDLMVKDLSIALEIGRDAGAPTPFAALCREMWASANAMLGPGEDHTAIAKLSEKLSGRKLSEPEDK